MRVSRLITISTVAVLLGGTSFAIGQASQASAASLQAAQEGGTISQGGARGSTEKPMRRSETSGERGTNVQGSRGLQRNQAMTAERGQAKPAEQIQGQPGLQPRQSFGQGETGRAYGRASAKETGVGLNAEQRARLREIVSARQDIPRVSNLTGVRVNAVVPRSMRLVTIPEEVVRIYPRFRRHQAFIYRNEIVVVDALTSKIVAVLPA